MALTMVQQLAEQGTAVDLVGEVLIIIMGMARVLALKVKAMMVVTVALTILILYEVEEAVEGHPNEADTITKTVVVVKVAEVMVYLMIG